jgi:hypothetical protein
MDPCRRCLLTVTLVTASASILCGSAEAGGGHTKKYRAVQGYIIQPSGTPAAVVQSHGQAPASVASLQSAGVAPAAVAPAAVAPQNVVVPMAMAPAATASGNRPAGLPRPSCSSSPASRI